MSLPPLLHRLLVALLAFAAMSGAPGRAAQLRVQIEHRWRGAPLVLNRMGLRDDAGEELSVTRLAYLLSRAQLQRADGSWIGANDWFAYVDPEKSRTAFSLGSVPSGKYTALRFDLGLEPAVDKSDPARRPAEHPLHPDVNGLHWGWRGGYVFLAVEGRVRGEGDALGGFSYHLAGEACRGTVEVPADLDLRGDLLLTLAFDVDRLFSAEHRVRISDAVSTHSREDDALASRLADNAVRAFAFARLEPDPDGAAARPFAAAQNALPAIPGGVEIRVPAHFPPAEWPKDNLPTVAGAALGRRLFHETRLSRNNSQSCASCHDPTFAFSDPRPLSLGVDGAHGTRNSMPLFNLAWKPAFFWDGRAPSLRAQALQPIQDPLEMNQPLESALAKLNEDAGYRAEFDAVFGAGGITADRLGRAIEQYLLTLVSSDTRFERALRGEAKLSDEEKQGFELFFTESDPGRGIRGADCFHCHGGAQFTNHQFLNNGLDADGRRKDEGRFRVTGVASDRGKFMVPSLRNVALTAPYMHDGRFATLEQVIEHYDRGIQPGKTLDPNLAKHLAYGGLGLTAEEKKALAAFLRTLTGEQIANQ